MRRVIERVGPDGRQPFYLALDQGIIMAAIRKELSDDLLSRAFSVPDIQSLVEPVIGVESFNDLP